MATENTGPVFGAELERLRSSPTAIPWPERHRLARSLAEVCAAGRIGEIRDLVHLLAGDPKWEVREQIALLLPELPDEDLPRLVSALLADPNGIVKRAAERVWEQRCKQERRAGRICQKTEHVERQLRDLDRRYGHRVALKARRMCERYQELLVGSIVHDLRSILTHLKANGNNLCNAASANGVAQRLVGRVRDDIQFLERVVIDMSAFTQPVSIERKRERLDDVIQKALALAQDNIRKYGFATEPVNVSAHVPGNVSVDMAKHMIVLAISNVIKNAYEAFVVDGKLCPGTIDIAARVENEKAVITIADNGMGIVEGEVVGRALFIPGRRNKTKRYSTGYGLAIAQHYLSAHGGTIKFASQENQGTTITFFLPLRSEEAHETASTGSRGRRARPPIHRRHAVLHRP